MLASYCGLCGKQFQSTDTFCAGCGTPRDDTNVPNTTLVSAPDAPTVLSRTAPLGRTPQAAEPANISKAATALCEIELKNGRGCGVAAVGRCFTCQRAFCGSHCAVYRSQYNEYMYSNTLCLKCQLDQMEAEREREFERLGPAAFFNRGRALELMRRSRVPKVNVYGGLDLDIPLEERWRERYLHCGYGWVLGKYRWVLDTSANRDAFDFYKGKIIERDYSSPMYTQQYVTVLLDDDEGVIEYKPGIYRYWCLLPVLPYADGYVYVYDHDFGMFTIDVGLAAEAVKKLVE